MRAHAAPPAEWLHRSAQYSQVNTAISSLILWISSFAISCFAFTQLSFAVSNTFWGSGTHQRATGTARIPIGTAAIAQAEAPPAKRTPAAQLEPRTTAPQLE